MQAGDIFLFHAPAGGHRRSRLPVGQASGSHRDRTVGSADKAELAKPHGSITSSSTRTRIFPRASARSPAAARYRSSMIASERPPSEVPRLPEAAWPDRITSATPSGRSTPLTSRAQPEGSLYLPADLVQLHGHSRRAACLAPTCSRWSARAGQYRDRAAPFRSKVPRCSSGRRKAREPTGSTLLIL